MNVAASTYWAGIVVSPLLHVVLAIVLAWASTPLLGKARIWVVPIAFLNFPVLQQAMPGRADHHVFLAITLAVAAGFTIRAILELDERRPAILAGISQAFALWASVEYAVLPVITMGFAGAWWVLAREPVMRRRVANQMIVFVAAMIAATAVWLVIERPAADLLAADLDRLSVVYLLFIGLAGVFWLPLRIADDRNWIQSLAARVGVVMLVGGIAVGVMWLVFPGFFAGPYSNVSPLVERFFLRHVSEVRSVFDLPPLVAAAYYSDAIIAVILLIWIVVCRPKLPTAMGWRFFFALAATYTALALFQLRFATAAAVLSVVPFTYLLNAVRLSSMEKPRAGAAYRILATFLIIIGPGLIAAAIPTPPKTAAEAALKYVCPVQKVAPFLNSLGRPHRILTQNFYIGPALLFYTPHAVVGTPYHRNIAGIEDTYRIMSDVDDREAQRLIDARGIDLILICRKKNLERFLPAKTADGTLHARLKRQIPPDWLAPVTLPDALNAEFALYAVKPRQ